MIVQIVPAHPGTYLTYDPATVAYLVLLWALHDNGEVEPLTRVDLPGIKIHKEIDLSKTEVR